MQAIIDKLFIQTIHDNIATLVMSVLIKDDSNVMLETKTYNTTFNILVDGEKEVAEAELQRQSNDYLPNAQAMCDYNTSSTDTIATIQDATTIKIESLPISRLAKQVVSPGISQEVISK